MPKMERSKDKIKIKDLEKPPALVLFKKKFKNKILSAYYLKNPNFQYWPFPADISN